MIFEFYSIIIQRILFWYDKLGHLCQILFVRLPERMLTFNFLGNYKIWILLGFDAVYCYFELLEVWIYYKLTPFWTVSVLRLLPYEILLVRPFYLNKAFSFYYLSIAMTKPYSIAMGLINSTVKVTLSPGITI